MRLTLGFILFSVALACAKPSVKTGDTTAVASTHSAPLEKTYWRVITVNGKPIESVEKQREASMTLHPEDHKVSGSGGCNRIAGSYTLRGDTLMFSPLAMTRMACPSGMADEHALGQALGSVSKWSVRGDTLWLRDSTNTELVRLEAELME